jgi:hypothetical protein
LFDKTGLLRQISGESSESVARSESVAHPESVASAASANRNNSSANNTLQAGSYAHVQDPYSAYNLLNNNEKNL